MSTDAAKRKKRINDVRANASNLETGSASQLTPQDPNVDPATLSPITPMVISNQATINIGTIGHVSHGKSTVVKAISGVHTVRYFSEMRHNITIKLGYANAKLYKCTNPKCPRPSCYRSYGSDQVDSPPCEVKGCGSPMKLMRHVSFVDCPGHDILMATMLSGAAVMDAALLLIAANDPCPQPQTSEHLAAIEIMKLETIIILQNKCDLIKHSAAKEHQKTIKSFVDHTVAKNAPILPISAHLRYNIDAVVEYLINKIPIPTRDFIAPSRLIIIRSFDVNHPGTSVSKLKGGVAGGSLLQGILRINDEIEIRPGIVSRDEEGEIECRPIRSVVTSLFAESNHLKLAVPGGLIGVGTIIDPTLSRADRLVGQVLGAPGTLPEIFNHITISYFLLKNLLGVRQDPRNKQSVEIEDLQQREMLLVNIGSQSTGGTVVAIKGDLAKLSLQNPVCATTGEKIALSRRIDRNWRLIGWGTISKGKAKMKGSDSPAESTTSSKSKTSKSKKSSKSAKKSKKKRR